MPQREAVVLEPRKAPVQARSTASVDAILQATIQVLLAIGKERLTTTRVAARAGVSVGTLYQYFPNKSALLQAALQRHLDRVAELVEEACRNQHGTAPRLMVTAVVTAFLEAKMRDTRTSVALYSVSSDLDGAKITLQMRDRWDKVLLRMLATSPVPLTAEPALISAMLQSVMTGVSRRLLESRSPEQDYAGLRRELIVMVCAYIDACTG